MKTLIIIPAYNEAENIKKVIDEINDLHMNNLDYIVINDCSQDSTENILKECSANYITLPINLGIGGGVQAGYIYAKNHGYDVAIQVDGDGQHDISHIKDLLNPIENSHADVVIGSRFIAKKGFQSSVSRRMGISFLSKLIYICCNVLVKDVTSGFRAVNKQMINILSEDYAQDYPEPEAIVTCALHNAKILEVPVVMRQRIAGVSSITTFKSVYYMSKVSIALILQRLILGKGRKIKDESIT